MARKPSPDQSHLEYSPKFTGAHTPLPSDNPWMSDKAILAHPDIWLPQHARDHGVKIAKYEDVLDPHGNVLPFVPFYADRMKAGPIRGALGTVYHGQGGPGFPALPQFRDKWGWANLANGNDFWNQTSESKGGKVYRHLSQIHPHGFVGMVYIGDHSATLGNSAFLPHLIDHLKAYGDQSPKHKDAVENHIRSLVRPISEDFTETGEDGESTKGSRKIGEERYDGVDDFHNKLRKLSTIARQKFLNSVVLAKGKGKEQQAFLQDLNMGGSGGALDQFNDYGHIPKNHAVALVRIPHNAKLQWKSDGHQVYPWHLEGKYLGDLAHAVDLSKVGFHIQSGVRAHKGASGTDLITGGEHGQKGQMELGVFGMHNPDKLGIDTTGIEHGNALAKALVIVPTENGLDVSKSKRYTIVPTQENPTMPFDPYHTKVHPTIRKAYDEIIEQERLHPHDPDAELAQHVDLVRQSQDPAVQNKIRQTLARNLPH